MRRYTAGEERKLKIKTADIRQSFLDFFQKNDHRLVPSSPVIPFDDPTILFINAGMNQFKDVFTGKAKSDFPRATSSQKCIRAGGKHNDLDNVGFTARHHTFFEMLGNFSFGDYFKEQAILYCWEWVTRDLGLSKDRLYASVYETDDEAFELWGKVAPELRDGRILRCGRHDNYWSMGDVGPCGPCSELHYDRGEKYGVGPQHVVNGETDRFVEIWNLVFMQNDQLPDGKVIDLPKPSVDTGAGLERIAAIMQGCNTNYGIDLFQNLVTAVSELTGSKYEDNISSHHVVADHIRALTFSLADGAGISNEGRGYVLRRILRRAARHGRKLGAKEPFIYRLVPVLVNEMGAAYPEIKEKQSHIENVIRAEEESFLRTLDTGLEQFEHLSKKLKKTGTTVVPGEDVFKLYDTYGFPYDLTEIIAGEQGLSLDKNGFEKAMSAQQERSKAAAGFAVEQGNRGFLEALTEPALEILPATKFVREGLKIDAVVQLHAVGESGEVAVVLDRTPFYAESGGQTGDTGFIYNDAVTIEVRSLFVHQGHYVHVGKVAHGDIKKLNVEEPVTAEVDIKRRWDIMRNHTATHLAHAALRKVLGDHVRQSGSYVGPDRLRFDFSHHQPMTAGEVAQVERIVNEQILAAETVQTDLMNVEAAKASGAMALFGEKYGDEVRVVSVGGFSKELCGGTHVQNVSQIGPFFVAVETGIASGVRRMEAITGQAALSQMLDNKVFCQKVAGLVGRPETEALHGVEQLKETAAALQKEIKKVKAEMVAGAGQTVGEESKIGELSVWTHDFGESDRDTMSAWIDNRKEQNEPVFAVGMGNVNGKIAVMLAASSSAVKSHNVHVGKITKDLLSRFGGRGGGKPNFAQGGVDEGTKAVEMFAVLKEMLKETQG